MGAHSSWGMSGQGRIIACPDSVNMGSYGEDETNRQAELGTAVHDMSEFAFRLGIFAVDLVGIKFNGFKANKSMADSAQEYLDILNKFRAIPTVQSFVEEKVCISSIDPKRLWGTSDYYGIDLTNRTLYVGDYKNGYGYVEVDGDQYVFAWDDVIKGCAQIIGYALGVLDTFNLWDKVDHVVTFIIQPNKPHIDGIVRSNTYDMVQMKRWWHVFKDSHELSLQPGKHRKAGPHCKYCRARGFCSTRIADTMKKLQLDTDFAHCKPEQLIALYPDVDVMIKSLEGIKKRVEKLARQGSKVPNHKLVKGIARAVMLDEDAFIEAAIAKGVNVDELYNKRLKGKTAVKPLVGKKIADQFYKVPEVGLTLVTDKDPRVAYRPDAVPDATGKFGSIL